MNDQEIIAKEEKEDERYDSKQFFRDIITIGILVFLVIIPIHTFLFQPFFVRGSSMEPNFKDGEYLIVGELGYKQTNVGIFDWNWFTVHPFAELKRYEVVVFHPPVSADSFYIKRVIGLPGETVQIKNGKIVIFNKDNPSGFVLKEDSYLNPLVVTGSDIKMTLASDEYCVLGDNRGMSQDSRFFGPVKKDRIIGKVVFRAWPFDRYGIL